MKRVRLLMSICVIGLLSHATIFGQTAYDSVFLVGDATPSGWNIGSPVPMIRDATDTNIFTWSGILTGGHIKLSTFTGNWCDGDWLNASVAEQPIDSASYLITHGCDGPDNQWVVANDEAGKYQLTVNFSDEIIQFNQVSQTSYENLYLVGDATPAGWSIAAPEPMIKDASNPYVFTWKGILTAGQFKISTFVGDWCDGDWLNASEADQAIADASYIVTDGCEGPDNKWLVTDSAEYVITINLADTLITIVPYVEPSYDMLYIVGDATPSGWNIASPIAMTKDVSNAKLFTWEGSLIAGELKFSTFTGDWCDGDWIIATQANQSITATDFTIRHGCDGDDNKWRLSADEAGNYKITINLTDSIINFEFKSGINYSGITPLILYPNPANEKLSIDLGEQLSANITIYNMVGQILFETTSASKVVAVDLKNIQIRGMILVKVATPKAIITSKILVNK
ncbi:MAG: SusF/SusE family outer membrane protein [Salinivirgaceae bacterium]|nr:SusF/SusE family outer membrane protein [Salinivirgaceae bacterium]